MKFSLESNEQRNHNSSHIPLDVNCKGIEFPILLGYTYCDVCNAHCAYIIIILIGSFHFGCCNKLFNNENVHLRGGKINFSVIKYSHHILSVQPSAQLSFG